MARERRKSSRRRVMAQAVCHISGTRYLVALTDASEEGCCALVEHCTAEVGDKVLLRITPTFAIPAAVAWIDEGRIGLEFSTPQIGVLVEQFVGYVATARRCAAMPSW